MIVHKLLKATERDLSHFHRNGREEDKDVFSSWLCSQALSHSPSAESFEIIKPLSLLWEGLHVNQSPKGDSFLKLPMAFPPLDALFFMF